MPQLDPSSFPSQVFWLAIIFVLLYLLLSRVTLPAIADILKGRKSKISADLDAADNLRKEAEDLEGNYLESVSKTKDEAQKMIIDAQKKAEDQFEEEMEKLHSKLVQKQEDAESKLNSARSTILSDMEKHTSDLTKDILKRVSGLKIDSKKVKSAVSSQYKKTG